MKVLVAIFEKILPFDADFYFCREIVQIFELHLFEVRRFVSLMKAMTELMKWFLDPNRYEEQQMV